MGELAEGGWMSFLKDLIFTFCCLSNLLHENIEIFYYIIFTLREATKNSQQSKWIWILYCEPAASVRYLQLQETVDVLVHKQEVHTGIYKHVFQERIKKAV